MRVYPAAILIAIVCVAFTRISDLNPGIIFGFVTAAMIFPRGAMSKHEKGMIIAAPLLGLMLVATIAFLLIDPLSRFSEANTGILAALPETIAVAIFVGGAESALLILLPVTFNDGEKIWAWSKLLWFLLAVPAAFWFFHIIVNDEELGGLSGDSSAVRLLLLCLVVLIIALATWLFFKLRPELE